MGRWAAALPARETRHGGWPIWGARPRGVSARNTCPRPTRHSAAAPGRSQDDRWQQDRGLADAGRSLHRRREHQAVAAQASQAPNRRAAGSAGAGRSPARAYLESGRDGRGGPRAVRRSAGPSGRPLRRMVRRQRPNRGRARATAAAARTKVLGWPADQGPVTRARASWRGEVVSAGPTGTATAVTAGSARSAACRPAGRPPTPEVRRPVSNSSGATQAARRRRCSRVAMRTG